MKEKNIALDTVERWWGQGREMVKIMERWWRPWRVGVDEPVLNKITRNDFGKDDATIFGNAFRLPGGAVQSTVPDDECGLLRLLI